MKRWSLCPTVAALLAVASLAPVRPAAAPDNTVTTVAGAGYGDGGPALDATLLTPSGLALGREGQIYIADSQGQNVRMIRSDGTITTVAGAPRPRPTSTTSTSATWSEGVPATQALLQQPTGVAVDPRNGDLYIADAAAAALRRVNSAGIITTPSNGCAPNTVPTSTKQSCFTSPQQITVDGRGRIIVADAGGNRVDVIDGGTVSVITGGCPQTSPGCSGAAPALSGPSGIAIDDGGNLYIADAGDQTIRHVDPSGAMTVIGGQASQAGFQGDGGPATQALFDKPSALALAGHVLYIADTGNDRLRRLDLATRVVTTVAGFGKTGTADDNALATTVGLDQPVALAVDRSGTPLVTTGSLSRALGGDSKNPHAWPYDLPELLRIGTEGRVHVVVGFNARDCNYPGGDGVFTDRRTPATQTLFCEVRGVAANSSGTLAIADFGADQVRRIAGGEIETAAGTGPSPASSSNGCPASQDGPAAQANLCRPRAVTVDANGDIYVDDSDHRSVRRITRTGGVSTVLGGGGAACDASSDGRLASQIGACPVQGLALDGLGSLYLTMLSYPALLWRLDLHTDVMHVIAGCVSSPTLAAGAKYPRGCPTTGQPGGGSPLTTTLTAPDGVTADRSGNVFIADSQDYQILKLAGGALSVLVDLSGGATGIVRQNWPSSQGGATGVGAASTFNGACEGSTLVPTRVSSDGHGNVYFVNGCTNDSAIRMVNPQGAVSAVAGTGPQGECGDGGAAMQACFVKPWDVAYASGALYVADGMRVRRIDLGGASAHAASSGGPLATRSARAGAGGGAASRSAVTAAAAAGAAPDGSSSPELAGQRVPRTATGALAGALLLVAAVAILRRARRPRLRPPGV